MGGASNTGGSGGGSYDLDDFVDEAVIAEKQDFAYLVRSKLASEHKRTSTVSGFEVRHMYGLLLYLGTFFAQYVCPGRSKWCVCYGDFRSPSVAALVNQFCH